MTEVFNYGGGRQTVAMCILIKKGVLPRPDYTIIANTDREKPSTWDYLTEITQPLLATIGLQVEIAPHSLAKVDLYGHNGDLLVPVFTTNGKLSAFCSTEWKARVVNRYLRSKGIETASIINWIGFAWDERKRIKGTDGRRFPLCDLMLTKADCISIIEDEGLPLPYPSSCWFCPNMHNEEWRGVKEYSPTDFEKACQIDEELRTEDIERGNGGVWLHHSRKPLREANLNEDDRREPMRQCGLGLCMI